jgi:hypothetical protein
MPPRSLESFFCQKLEENYDFFTISLRFEGASLSQKPLHHQNLIWSQNRKKIVNATKGPRTWFYAKISRIFLFVFDFFTIFVWNRTKIVKKKRKKIVNATKVPRIGFLAKNSRNLRFVYDFFTILGGFPFPEAFPPPEPDLEPKS